MFSILGAVLFGVIAIMTVLVACGLPLGEYTVGGQHKILPKKFRLAAVISVAIQIFAMIIILQAGVITYFSFLLFEIMFIIVFKDR
ncbi:putative membrane protein [Streptococcus sanguinis]|nr:putative membrane protein [Streptococcus sanguinis]